MCLLCRGHLRRRRCDRVHRLRRGHLLELDRFVGVRELRHRPLLKLYRRERLLGLRSGGLSGTRGRLCVRELLCGQVHDGCVGLHV